MKLNFTEVLGIGLSIGFVIFKIAGVIGVSWWWIVLPLLTWTPWLILLILLGFNKLRYGD